jgi:hypothetical protein
LNKQPPSLLRCKVCNHWNYTEGHREFVGDTCIDCSVEVHEAIIEFIDAEVVWAPPPPLCYMGSGPYQEPAVASTSWLLDPIEKETIGAEDTEEAPALPKVRF